MRVEFTVWSVATMGLYVGDSAFGSLHSLASMGYFLQDWDGISEKDAVSSSFSEKSAVSSSWTEKSATSSSWTEK